MINKSGIYQIKNIINDKNYIGSAVNLRKRKNDHFYSLDRKIHCNDYLQKSYNKYGRDVFVFSILFTCPKEDLTRIEQYCIDNYNSEYNICKVAGSALGVKRSKETKALMSQRRLGMQFTSEHKNNLSAAKLGKPSHRKKIVYKICMDTNIIIEEYSSVKDACNTNNLTQPSISNCALGRMNSAGGFKWKYKDA